MYKIFSVDDHIIEPPTVWSSRVPVRYRDAAPHVIEEDGRQYWVYENQRAMTMGLNAVAGKPFDQWNIEPARFSDMIPGCYDPKERARDMLSQGVLASVCFPSLPRFGGLLFNSFKDKELASACVSAWNDFVLDEWCPGGPSGMFVPMVICQVWDPDLAVTEIQRCADKGAKALCFVENPVPEGLPGFHTPHWDRLWAAVQELNLPVCMHIGSSGYIPVLDPAAELVLTIALANVTGMLALVNLLLSPVFQKFPDLQVVLSEAGIGWIPAVLERTDRQWERHRGWTRDHGSLRPSEIFRRNVYACMVDEPLGIQSFPDIGADRILAETDYPHADATYPFTQKSYEEVFTDIPAEVVEAITHGNAERLFDWRMADEGLLAAPEVSAWRHTLEENPFSASTIIHEVAGITVDGSRHSTRCSEVVMEGGFSRACDAPIGDDGRCRNGHLAGTAAGAVSA